MAELVVIQKDRELFRRDLVDGTVTIGRGAHNDIRLNSPTVAERHARISLFQGECQIQNLAAPGDTFVNDREVQRAELFDHDVVHIGHYKIALQGEGLKPRPAPDEADVAAQAGSAPATETASAREDDVLGQISELESTLGPYLSKRRPPAANAAASDGDAAPAPLADEAPVGAVESAVPAETPDAGPEPAESQPREVDSPADTPLASNYGLLSTGVDILSGPAKGKRIYFTQQSAKLGVGDDPVVTIQAARNGYIALAADNGINAAINGDALMHDPVPLDDGDVIDFANLRARFFIES